MSTYKSVQFIAWEIYTGPVYGTDGNAYDYAGIQRNGADRRLDVRSQCIDISARVEFTRLAVEQAFAAADPSRDVLKIFVAPEFLYRGSGGAYLHDLMNGWESSPFPELPEPYCNTWSGLFGELQGLVEDDKFEDWIFVFGTAVSAAFDVKDGDSVKAYLDGMESVMCMNSSLIQCGGSKYKDKCYVTQKHLKSSIDFIKFQINMLPIHYHENVQPFTPEFIALLDNLTVREGGATFYFPHICHLDGNCVKFGIEVCLDHACSGRHNAYGRLRAADQRVDIQLVPSGGMRLMPDSVYLLPEEGEREFSYVFGCDGCSTLDSMFYAAHIQLWNQLADEKCNPVTEVNNSLDPNDTTHFKLPDIVNFSIGLPGEPDYEEISVNGSQLWRSMEPFDPRTPNLDESLLGTWPSGSGFVRVLPAEKLNPNGTVIQEWPADA